MADITPDKARAYFKRFELLSEAEVEALRTTPIEVRFRQLAALMESRHLFEPEPDREEGVRLVRERWALLRQAMGG
jgi:RecB family exonuclease